MALIIPTEPAMFRTDKPSILAMPRGVLALWLAAFVAVATAITWGYAPTDWGLVRVLIAGTLMGAMSFYMLFINRLLVS
jgi:hypothetical protein